MPLLLKEFAGLKIRLVAGYAANSDILLAVERKEADAYSALATTIQLAVDRGAVRPLVRSRTPVPGWNHLPTDESLATNDTGQRADGDPRHPAVDRTRLRRAAGNAAPIAWRCCAKGSPRP